MSKILMFLIFMPKAYGGDLMEVAQMVALSQGQSLEEVVPLQKSACNEDLGPGDGDKKKVSGEVLVSFQVTHMSGLNTERPDKRFLDTDQIGFEAKWDKLIQGATNESNRDKVIKDICSDMSKEDAVAFAGYIGMKNNNIYDDRRNSQSPTNGNDYENEIITMDDYYQTHRNNEGFGNVNHRRIMGVCGDSAAMVADFLKRCKFSCEDIDIVSYRTGKSGHQMVSARGDNGEFYSANWSEGTVSQSSLLEYTNPDPSNIRTSPTTNIFGCDGRPKGKTLTPLGTILMMAHEDNTVLNSGAEYSELAAVIENFKGVNEIKLKAFRGRSTEGDEVVGLGAKVSHEFGSDNTLLQFKTEGSVILAKASRPFEYRDDYDMQVDQLIFSPRAATRLSLNAISKDDVRAGAFVEGDVTAFIYSADVNDPNSGYSDKNNNGDVQSRVAAGLKVSGEDGNILYRGEAGVRAIVERNVSQKGGMEIDGKIVERTPYNIIPYQAFASGEMTYVMDKDNSATVSLNYQNAYLLRRSTLEADVVRNIKSLSLQGGMAIIKNPGQDAIKSLKLGANKEFRLKGGNSLEVGGQVQYLILQQIPNTTMFNARVALKLK